MVLDYDVRRLDQLNEGDKIRFQNPSLWDLLTKEVLLRRFEVGFQEGFYCSSHIIKKWPIYTGTIVIAKDRDLKRTIKYSASKVENIN